MMGRGVTGCGLSADICIRIRFQLGNGYHFFISANIHIRICIRRLGVDMNMVKIISDLMAPLVMGGNRRQPLTGDGIPRFVFRIWNVLNWNVVFSSLKNTSFENVALYMWYNVHIIL